MSQKLLKIEGHKPCFPLVAFPLLSSPGKGIIYAMKNKHVYIIAGPNGSGKTTFAKEFLPHYAKCPHFINADLIAQGLAPFEPRSAALKAGKLVLQQIHEFTRRGVDFSLETTLSGKSYAILFEHLKDSGYLLHLFFLWIPKPELAIARIKERVLEGGHHVPDEDVRRRFKRGIDNFFRLYEPLVDSWMFFNNAEQVPIVIAKRNNGHTVIINSKLFESIKKRGTL